MDIEAMIRGVQKELGIGVDGRAGPQTWAAIYHRVTGKKPTPDASPSGGPPASGGVDARSE
jgi:peptidoglycan L-alanyl-D-glutamate endopeptidase CwlK